MTRATSIAQCPPFVKMTFTGLLPPSSSSVFQFDHLHKIFYTLHDGKLIHRDIKPENMLLDREDTIVLTDFGIALMAQSSRYQSTQEVAGTAAYMAPEQFQDAKRVDVRCDVYSLGATLYMAVTGSMPFSGRWPFSILEKKVNDDLIPPRELAPTLSEQIDLAIRRAVRADPNQRYATCLDFIEALTGKNQESSHSTVPWERRGRVRYDSRMEVECLLVECRNHRAGLAKVRDVSASGIGLIFNRPFELGTILGVELPRVDLKPNRTLFARVVRAHEQPSAKWIVGCAFNQELTDSDIRALRG